MGVDLVGVDLEVPNPPIVASADTVRTRSLRPSAKVIVTFIFILQ